MTELSPVCHMTPAGNDKHGSVGVLLPNLRCKVRLSRYLDRETACMHQMDRPHIHHNIPKRCSQHFIHSLFTCLLVVPTVIKRNAPFLAKAFIFIAKILSNFSAVTKWTSCAKPSP